MDGRASLSIIAFTEKGCRLADKYAESLKRPMLSRQWQPALYTVNSGYCEKSAGEWTVLEEGVSRWCEERFTEAVGSSAVHGILFIGACGIAVRTIAPCLKGKTMDPAVLVSDEAGQYIIPLLSGHLGGANELALALAARIGACPVITTASDVNGKTGVDVFAKKNHLRIADMAAAKRVAAAIVAGERVGLYCEAGIKGRVPEEFCLFSTVPTSGTGSGAASCCVVISPHIPLPRSPYTLHLIPKAIILGIGCRKGTTADSLQAFVAHILERHALSVHSILCIVTIELKREERGLLAFAEKHKIPLRFYAAEELNRAPGKFHSSLFVKRTTGTDNVCERAVFCFDPDSELIQGRIAADGMTVALGKRKWSVKFE